MKISTIFLSFVCTGFALSASAQQVAPVKKNLAVRLSKMQERPPLYTLRSARVLERHRLTPGVCMEVYEDYFGGISKRLCRIDDNSTLAARRLRPVFRAGAEDSPTIFYEDFEAWDGGNADWLPEGWSEKNTNAEQALMEEGRFTWHVDVKHPQQTIPNAVEGTNFAIVYYANTTGDDGKKVDLAQDEWMISPKIRLGEEPKLSFYLGYSPMFLFDLNNENINWGQMDFVNRKPSTTLKVMISADGADWEEVYDVYDEWCEVAFSDLFNSYFDSSYYPVELLLDDYAGKEVQVAFRFVGKFGNTMEIDAVRFMGKGGEVVGVRPLNVSSEASVAWQDNCITVRHYEGRVKVFDATGRCLSDVLAQGAAEIPTQGFPEGVLFVRLNDGRSFKLVRGE